MVLDSSHGRMPDYLALYIPAVAAGEIVEFRRWGVQDACVLTA